MVVVEYRKNEGDGWPGELVNWRGPFDFVDSGWNGCIDGPAATKTQTRIPYQNGVVRVIATYDPRVHHRMHTIKLDLSEEEILSQAFFNCNANVDDPDPAYRAGSKLIMACIEKVREKGIRRPK